MLSVLRPKNWMRSGKVVRAFLPYLGEHRWQLAFALLLTTGAAAVTLMLPWTMQWIFDGALVRVQGAGREPQYYIWTGAAAAFVLTLAKALLEYFGTLRVTGVGHAFTRALRLRIFDHLTELSPLYHTRKKAGDLLIRLMGDVPMVSTMLVDSGVLLVTRMLLITGTVVMMFFIDPLLAAVLLAALPLLALTVRLMAGRVQTAVRKQRRKEGAMADFLHEAIDASTVLQALGQTRHTVRRFARSNRRTARAGMKVAKAAAALSAVVEGLLGVLLVIALAYGSNRVLDGAITPGKLLAFLSYVRGLAKPIRSAAKHAAKVAKGAACGERILEVLHEERAVRNSAGSRTAPDVVHALSFEGVGFQYEAGVSALDDVSFTLKPGELTILFGPSGSGKSTISALGLRLFDPLEGCIALNGVELKDYDLDQLRSCFGVSLQDSFLFGESVRENLMLGDPDAQDQGMWNALEKVGASDLVNGWEEGLDTVLGASGATLSGGERRRLCLARALLRRKPILLVDEPFAGLDGEVAERVAAALREHAKDHVVLLITHVVQRLEDADRVLFLEGGALRGNGKHHELLAENARYRELCAFGPEQVA